MTDRRSPRDGRFIERVGYYNPMARGQDIQLQVKKERIEYWFSQGAKASLRAKHLIKKIEQFSEKAERSQVLRDEFKSLQEKELTTNVEQAE